jgi:N-acetylglutamate synthase-like GNAT family acetyltransferase
MGEGMTGAALITRASRRDRADIGDFYAWEGSAAPDLSEGVAFIARQGPIVACVRLIEVAPQTVVVEDVVVHAEHRGRGLGAELMRAAMNSRGGTLYLCCHEGALDFYGRIGFGRLDFQELPDIVQTYMRAHGGWPSPEGHEHFFMTAR